MKKEVVPRGKRETSRRMSEKKRTKNPPEVLKPPRTAGKETAMHKGDYRARAGYKDGCCVLWGKKRSERKIGPASKKGNLGGDTSRDKNKNREGKREGETAGSKAGWKACSHTGGWEEERRDEREIKQ